LGEDVSMLRRTLYTLLVLATACVMVWPMFGVQTSVEAKSTEPTIYSMYFGDLHTHTAYSDAWEGTPWDAYAAAIDAGADFMAVTDHVGFWHAYQGLAMDEEEWADTLLAADHFTSEDFVAMAGYEAWLLAKLGEVNVYNIDQLPPQEQLKVRSERLPDFYEWLAQQTGAIGQFNHPLYMSKDFENYAYLSESRDGAMSAIEVYNAENYEASYIKALDAGWHVMPTANSDTHNPDWISGSEVRTVLLAPSLTPDNLYDAIRQNRGYGTLDKNLEVYFAVDGAVMGSTLTTVTSTCTATIHIEDPDGVASDAITLVEIVSDEGIVVASMSADSTVVDWTVTLDTESASYYYLRVTTASALSGGEGVTAWTAPVWTG